MNRKRLTVMILIAGGATLLPVSPGVCQSVDQEKVTKLKAAFLYNFGKFVAWPEGAFADKQSPIVIGVLGDDPFGRILAATVKGKTARERAFVIKRFASTKSASGEELRKCHILYFPQSESDHVQSVLKAVNGAHVLTVGEGSPFAIRGGVMAFGFDGDKLTVYVNREQAGRAKLKISAKLLKRATIVKSDKNDERAQADEARSMLAVGSGNTTVVVHRPTRPGKT